MADFNAFEFIKNRYSSIEPTDIDLDNFNHFMAQRVLSMTEGYENIANNMNTEQFFALPKHIQCYAYTQFDGKYLGGKWKLAKKTISDSNTEYIKMVMKVLKCSRNDAMCYINHNNLDRELIEEIYTRLYEPDKIKFRSKKGKKSGK